MTIGFDHDLWSLSSPVPRVALRTLDYPCQLRPDGTHGSTRPNGRVIFQVTGEEALLGCNPRGVEVVVIGNYFFARCFTRFRTTSARSFVPVSNPVETGAPPKCPPDETRPASERKRLTAPRQDPTTAARSCHSHGPGAPLTPTAYAAASTAPTPAILPPLPMCVSSRATDPSAVAPIRHREGP